jgi:hypothetical protein
MARTAHPNSCSSKKRTPKCKKCQQKATSQCVFVHGQVLVGKAAGRSSELKLLQLDPNALNRRNSEIEARPLSPLRNRPLESHQHAQKKNRIEIQQVERSPAALPAVERDENTPPANSSIRKQPGGLSRELPALCADASPSSFFSPAPAQTDKGGATISPEGNSRMRSTKRRKAGADGVSLRFEAQGQVITAVRDRARVLSAVGAVGVGWSSSWRT